MGTCYDDAVPVISVGDMNFATVFTPGLGTSLWVSALVVIGTMMTAYGLGRCLHRYRDIDVFWPLGFVAIAWSGFLLSSSSPGSQASQRILLLCLTSLWGLRLAIHLGWRGRGHGEDPRYEALLRRGGNRHPVLFPIVAIYGLQGVLMWVISLTVTVGMYVRTPLVGLQVVGAVIWLVGFLFESVGDYQLIKFTGDPRNQGKVLATGLWSWTRHPNYFGDVCVWWGLFVVTASGGWGALTLVSPLLMTILLTRVSGKPLLEARMKSTRAGFDEYVQCTSSFLPRPPKRRYEDAPDSNF